LNGTPGSKYGSLALTSLPTFPDKTKLVVVEHPGGEPKQVSIKDCAVQGTTKMGVQSKSDFGHTCDTLGGSSGSPVMRLSDGVLVGLHHFGFTSGDLDPVNQAVYIHLVIEDIRAHVPALAAGIPH
jgi:V8-like Glu-specific endopeptidase